MKRILLSCIMMAVAINAHSQTEKKESITKNLSRPVSSEATVNPDWLSSAQRNIAAQEYYFKNTLNSKGLYAATNRQQKTVFAINPFGYSVSALQFSDKPSKNRWTEEITLHSIQKGSQSVLPDFSNKASNVKASQSHIVYHHKHFSIEYINSNSGLRQNFIINDKPEGDGNIQLALRIKGSLVPKVINNQLQFEDKDGLAMLYYRDLKVWDAENKTLGATMALNSENELVINVDDRNASYPITIDPINQIPEWSGSAEGILPGLVGQLAVDAAYGFSVAGLGDINGDGYDDVAIGAPAMADIFSGTGALAGVGAVFVYYGSPYGLPAQPNAVLQPTTAVAGALFGYSIAGGDIDNDGKSDIIVGAPLDKVTIAVGGGSTSSGNVGKVYAFNGATLATTTTPFITLQLNGKGILEKVNLSSNALFGFSVAVTEDLNSDGKKDIIVGAPAYAGVKAGLLGTSLLDVQSGGAFVFLSNSSDNNKTLTMLNQPESDLLGLGLLKSNINGLLFGYSVDGLGDYNGDGKPDVIVGAPAGVNLASINALLTGKLLQGSAMVYYGTGSGVSSGVGATLTATSGGLLTNLVGSVANVANLFGTSIKGTRDVSGVRNGNVLVGAPLGGAITNVLSLQLKTGTVSLFKKKTSSPSGYVSPDQVLSSPRNDNNILGLIQTSLLFGYSIDNTLDVNCDGFADIVIGEPASSGAQLISANVAGGAAYVYLGKANGTYEATPAWTMTATTDGLLGVNAVSLIGYSVAGAGHVKGISGAPRVLIGSPSRTLDFGSGLLNLGNTFGTLFGLAAGDNGVGKVDLFDTKLCQLSTLALNPVQLKASYSNSIAHLTWSTSQGNNAASFEIEHSIDGARFIEIGKVNATGSSKEINFEFNDAKVNSGTNFYRLKMIDADGSFQYSNVALIKAAIKGLYITNVYPSPFNDKINVDVTSENAGQVDIKITNITGGSVFDRSYKVNQGAGTISITGLGGLSRGLYMMQVQHGNEMSIQKILKQ